jgi:hypothetical protein
VVADSWFGNNGLYRPPHKSLGPRFSLISRLRPNRNVFAPPGRLQEKMRGRPAKYGAKPGAASVLAGKFKALARPYEVNLYGRVRTVAASEHQAMLKTIECAVKAVWVYRGNQYVARFSTDTTLSLQQIIEYYGARWKIEAAFEELKRDIGYVSWGNVPLPGGDAGNDDFIYGPPGGQTNEVGGLETGQPYKGFVVAENAEFAVDFDMDSVPVEPVAGVDLGPLHGTTEIGQWQGGELELPTGGKVSMSDPNLVSSEGMEWYLIEFHHRQRDLTGEDLPDNLVVSFPSAHTLEAATGEEIALDVTVANTGNSDAVSQDGSTEWNTTLHLSDDDQFAEDTDTELVEIARAELAAGTNKTRTLTFNAPAEPGTYYLAAKADDFNAVPESDESNNWSGIVTLTVADSDSDNDGLPDRWEEQIVDADPGDHIETVEDVLPGDDFDNDGWTNLEEYESDSNPLGWTCTLTVTGAGDDYPSVGFGMHADASEDEDDYDIDAPQPPPVDEAAVCFEQLRVSYQRDIRPIAEVAEWFLVVEAGLNDPVTLDRDATECPGTGCHLTLFAVDGDRAPVNGTFLISLPFEPAGDDACPEPTLMMGWNLVGCPFTMPVPDPEQYHLRVRCWQWDAREQIYRTVMRPGFGYWLNAGENNVTIPIL